MFVQALPLQVTEQSCEEILALANLELHVHMALDVRAEVKAVSPFPALSKVPLIHCGTTTSASTPRRLLSIGGAGGFRVLTTTADGVSVDVSLEFVVEAVGGIIQLSTTGRSVDLATGVTGTVEGVLPVTHPTGRQTHADPPHCNPGHCPQSGTDACRNVT